MAAQNPVVPVSGGKAPLKGPVVFFVSQTTVTLPATPAGVRAAERIAAAVPARVERSGDGIRVSFPKIYARMVRQLLKLMGVEQ